MSDDSQLIDGDVDPLIDSLGLDGDDPLVDDPDLADEGLLIDEEEI